MRHNDMRWQMRAAVVALLVAAARAHAQESATRIVVSIPDRKLALIEDGEVVKIWETAVGAPVSPSPTGVFKVVTHIANPTYFHTGKVIGPGKNNPLGTRWMGLSLKGYGIHGTNVPRSIGKAASHGCIRMRNEDVEELFELVSVGAVVELRGERDDETESLFRSAADATPVAATVMPETVHGGE